MFTRVAEMRSFTKAAKESGLSPSLASKQISWLESRLGAKLLHRSTRRVSLTETGEQYYVRCLKVLNEADAATNIVAELHGAPQGHLRLTCPSGLGVSVLNQAFAQFSLAHPSIHLETWLTDQVIDFTEGRIDYALRLAQALPDSSLVASELARIKLHICASSSYLDKHGAPSRPEDLADHNCLRYVHTRTGSDVWHLKKDGKVQTINVTGNYRTNNPNFMKEAVRQGLGIAILPSYTHRQETRDGSIKVLFRDYDIEELKLYLIRQHRDHLPLRMKLFSEFIKRWAAEYIATGD